MDIHSHGRLKTFVLPFGREVLTVPRIRLVEEKMYEERLKIGIGRNNRRDGFVCRGTLAGTIRQRRGRARFYRR